MNRDKNDKTKKFFKKYCRPISGFWKRREERGQFNILEVTVLIVISIFFGFVVGCILTYGNHQLAGIEISDKLEDLVVAYNSIFENYYDEISEDDLVNAAVDGMIQSLDDPYSNYMTEEETEVFNQEVNGSYVGIGATVVWTEDKSYVSEIIPDSPADKAGLQVNDVLLEIDGSDVSTMSLTEISNLMKGETGTKVKIKILRGEEEISLKLTREVVELSSVTSNVFERNDQKIGYLAIDIFASNTYKQFNKQLKSLEKQEINSLILDVRDNPGGHLDQIDDILSLFFNKKTVLYQIESKGAMQKVYSAGSKNHTYSVAVLINGSSASASEILASCFQDNDKNAVIIGTSSYGKGTVQKSLELSTGASLKYTTERWLTAKGTWLNGEGVVPDIVVEQSSEYQNSPSYDTDAQLQKAIEVLTKEES